MKVLILSDGDDNGGVGAAIKIAFARHAPDWEITAVRRRNNFINFPGDITVPDLHEILPLYQQADLVHMMDKFSTIEWAPRWDIKPRLMHHHGLAFKPSTAAGFVKRCREEGILQIAALPGLTQYGAPGEIEWLPNPCDIDMMQALRRANWKPHPRLRISQTPAQRAPNATHVFIQAVEALGRRVEMVLIERKQWSECLPIKATSDISFDSFISGYGLAGMEAMAMGIPLVSGVLDDYTEQRIRSELGFLPYHPATDTNLASRLLELVDSPSLRAEYAAKGLDFARRVHDERLTVERLKSIYQRAMEGGSGA